MNRTAKCIKMLRLLHRRSRMSREQLADYLETNPRNIIEFREELEEAGYTILSHTGKYGGYELDKGANLLPQPSLTQEEATVINEGVEFLRENKEFANIKEFELAFSKFNVYRKSNDVDVAIYQRFPLAMAKDEIQNRLNILKKAIKDKKKVMILYTSKENEDHVHIIHPYKIYLYADSWFVLAQKENEEKKDLVLYYKVNRIKEMTILPNVFRIPEYYKESDYLDDFGMKKNGDWIRIKLLMSNNANIMIGERIYGRNQVVEKIDQNSSIMTATMQDKELLSFILSWGSNCKVLEPAELVERVKDEIKKTQEIY